MRFKEQHAKQMFEDFEESADYQESRYHEGKRRVVYNHQFERVAISIQINPDGQYVVVILDSLERERPKLLTIPVTREGARRTVESMIDYYREV